MAYSSADLKAALARRKAAKKKGTYLGFSALRARLARRKDVKNPDAMAAMMGRKKYGKAGMEAMSAMGKKMHATHTR